MLNIRLLVLPSSALLSDEEADVSCVMPAMMIAVLDGKFVDGVSLSCQVQVVDDYQMVLVVSRRENVVEMRKILCACIVFACRECVWITIGLFDTIGFTHRHRQDNSSIVQNNHW